MKIRQKEKEKIVAYFVKSNKKSETLHFTGKVSAVELDELDRYLNKFGLSCKWGTLPWNNKITSQEYIYVFKIEN